MGLRGAGPEDPPDLDDLQALPANEKWKLMVAYCGTLPVDDRLGMPWGTWGRSPPGMFELSLSARSYTPSRHTPGAFDPGARRFRDQVRHGGVFFTDASVCGCAGWMVAAYVVLSGRNKSLSMDTV